MKKIFYVRVSRSDLNEENQLNTLVTRYGQADRVFIDKGQSGSKEFGKRPAGRELLDYLAQNPECIVCSVALDRMGRNSVDVCATVRQMTAEGHVYQSVREGCDFSTSMGKLILSVLSAVAEMERDNIIERTHSGLETARKAGRVGGKRTTETGKIARQMLLDGATVAQVIADTGMSKAMVYRIKAELSGEAA